MSAESGRARSTPAILRQDDKAAGATFWDANPCGGTWASCDEWEAFLRRAEPYTFETLEAHDWRGRRVLDVGCGQGPFMRALSRLGATVVGIDRSRESVTQAARAVGDLGLPALAVNADAERLPFADATFDAVISIGVLHHTPNTRLGIEEVARVLKTGGFAIVMLYRRGTPKWWAVALLRSASQLADRVLDRRDVITDVLRRRTREGSPTGTALLELFGVPTMKAFTNREARRMFAPFAGVTITNRYPGFARLPDVWRPLRHLARPLAWIDHRFHRPMGFYQFIVALKK